jgi:TrmH family RNA methyltransferase
VTVKTAAQPRLRPIEGRHNPRVKELRQAFDSADLTADGYCAVEGMHLVEEAIRSGLRFRAVYFAESAQNRAQRLLPQIGAQVETLLLPDKLFAGAVPSGTPQGVAALVKVRVWTPSEVIARAKSVPLLLIAGLQDPGNLGTILRSAEAFGAAGVLLGEGTVSPFNSKVIRASAGSLFRVATAQAKLKPTILEIREAGIRVLATSSHKGTPLPETKLNGAFAVLIGGEGAGVPRDLLSEVDEVIAIPHAPQVESLNAGVAASIVMYEAARQRTQ